jgi:CheY-like chemotaxis protein
LTKNEIEHRARLVFEPGAIGAVYANEARLGQVFLNLLINAVQAIDPGRADENVISVKTSVVNNQVIVEIKDSGCGIPEEMKDRLFQPFQTTKPVGQGTGLGLSICSSIVQKYHGTIECESAAGAGALFRVILPVSAVPEAGKTLQQEVTTAGRGENAAGKRVLIVDDDKEVLDMFHEIVARQFEVKSYRDSREALNVLNRGERFDCIVCDLMMPNIGGMEFYKRLQEVSPEHLKKVIFITGGSFATVTDQFLRTPGIVFLEKPIGFKELLVAVERITASK